MINSLKRAQQCRQVGQVEINISVNGTATTPVASGPDAAFVQSITDNGTGDYTITLKESAKIALHVSSLVLATADSSIIVHAVSTSTVQVRAKSVAGSPAAKDVDFSIQIKFMDQLSYYF
jgi:two-component sensor histidine kinase